MDSETVAKIRAEVSNPKPRWDTAENMAACQEKAAQGGIGGAIPMGYCDQRAQPRSKAEQMIYELANRAKEGSEAADRAQQGLDFFQENPAFVEFIALIRSGAIQF
jgi:hypothetical protein